MRQKEKIQQLIQNHTLYWMYLCIPVFYIILSGCAGSQPGMDQPSYKTADVPVQAQFVVPPGVDSTLALRAFTASETLFVSIADEALSLQKMQSGRAEYQVFNVLNELFQDETSLTDRSVFIERLRAAEVPVGIKRSIGEKLAAQDFASVIAELRRTNSNRLLRIMHSYEQAHQLNPFNMVYMVDLALIYSLLGNDRTNADHFAYKIKAIELLIKAIRKDRSDHRLYARLGEFYHDVEDWENSKRIYIRALSVMRKFEFFPFDISDVSYTPVTDTATVFRYLNYIIQSHVNLRDSDGALKYIQEAESFARDESEVSLLVEYRDLINWARGDIRARQIYIEAEVLRNAGNYLAAAVKYHDVLERTQSVAKRAYWETAYQLSLLEYTHLMKNSEYIHRFPLASVGPNRLRDVIRAIPKDQYGIPQEDDLLHYFNSLGIMLHAQGVDAIESNEKHRALALFQQGALLHSESQARCSLELTKLTMVRGLVGLRWALKAYSLKDQLSKEELAELYQLLRFVTKRANNPQLCHYFHEEYRAFALDDSNQCDKKTETFAYEFLRSGYSQLNKYLQRHLGLRQDPSFIQFYQDKYIESIRSLTPDVVQGYQSEITRVYQNMGDMELMENWQQHQKGMDR